MTIQYTSDLSVIRASAITCCTCDASIVVTGGAALPAGWRVVGIGRPVPHDYRYYCPACAARETIRVRMRCVEGRWELAT